MELGSDNEKSKSKVKRELHALQDLGRELVELPDKQLVKIPLPEPLLQAIREARTMSRGARQRQLRYIGGLLPHEDVDLIRAALHEVLHPGREAVERFHGVERSRDELLAGGEEAVTKFIERFPDADRQQLRRLVRNAHKEQKENKPPKSARLLFKFLRNLLDPIA